MNKGKFFVYFGIGAWLFEELCDELKEGIDSSLERRGLKGIENDPFRNIIIGESTATPLLSKYSAFISTELDSSIANLNGAQLKIERTPIDPSVLLNQLQKDIKKIISIRNTLVHGSWSPQLLGWNDIKTVSSWRKKVSEKGIELVKSEFTEIDFENYIRKCEIATYSIKCLNYCLNTSTSLDFGFELKSSKIIPKELGELKKSSVLNEMKSNIEAMA
ncbi:hypothetical protein [Vibrio lentus]|uniref:hypothetical protein n=1 Tax=Vibrio lentus TaxID=136468 RepID=UPI00178CF720|nr:hypothetical protein [Vibrio lentus]MDN3630953.1 hypothetical protein [Vibrio lentus]